MGHDAPTDAELKEWGTVAHLATEQPGLAGETEVAVPIVGHDGATVAALVATGAPPRLSREEMISDVVPLLLHIAAQAGRVLGNA
jgi:DNA-binding IclR family transcriptional regulator